MCSYAHSNSPRVDANKYSGARFAGRQHCMVVHLFNLLLSMRKSNCFYEKLIEKATALDSGMYGEKATAFLQ